MFETLPKVRAYTHLGRYLSQEEFPCTWDPSTWANCINVFRNARREFQEAYTKILQMEVSYQVAMQHLNNSPDSPQKDDLIILTQQRAAEAADLRREGVAIANLFEEKVAAWSNIPGFSTVFLDGLSGLGRLGVVPAILPAAVPPIMIFYTIAGVIGFVSIAYIVGAAAHAWTAHEDEQIAAHNAWGQCMKAYDNAISAGQQPPNCGEPSTGTDLTTLALIAGAVILAVMVMRK